MTVNNEEVMTEIERKRESKDVPTSVLNEMKFVVLAVSVFCLQSVGSPLWMNENETGIETIVKVDEVVTILAV